MKAIVFHGERELTIESFEDPTAEADEVVIQVKASGMCGSDLHTFRGPKKADTVIAGHEPAGVVVAARRRGLTMSPQLWLWIAVTALIGLAFARSPSYFDHYAGFFAAPFAVGLGVVLAASSVGAVTWRAAATAAVLALMVPATFWSVKGDATWRSDPSMASRTCLRELPRPHGRALMAPAHLVATMNSCRRP